MAVVVKAELSEPPRVEWWMAKDEQSLEPASPQDIRSARAEEYLGQWVTLLEPLPLGRRLVYRVRSQRGDSKPTAFRAGAHRGTRYRFVAFGDTRTGHRVHRDVVEAAAQEDVDFLLHTGDMVDQGGKADQWDLFFQIEQPLLARAPIVPAIGNHDMSPRDYFGQVFLTTYWADSFNYYYQDWGDLRIVAVDSGIECRTGCTQNLFARRALSEGAKKGMHMLISLHHPPYSSGAHGSYLNIRRAVSELARLYGVELVITGHDHNYERTKRIDGTYYVVAAAAGAPVRPVDPEPFSDVVRTEAHYVLMDVTPQNMTLRAVNLKGETFDSVVIDPNPPRPRG
jgi:predicted phosphodiesterase